MGVIPFWRRANHKAALLSSLFTAPSLLTAGSFENWILASEEQFTARSGHEVLVHNNQMWLLGGYPGVEVYRSSDGVTWTQVPTAASYPDRVYHAAEVFAGRMWIFGGEDYELPTLLHPAAYSSTDGANWVLEGEEEWPTPARRGQESAVYQGKLWITGGHGRDIDLLNDVWSSTDGADWEQVTPSAAFPPREGHAMVVFQERMWILGGNGAQGSLNDVWSSTDGLTWTQEPQSAPYQARRFHTATVFQNKLYILAGAEGNSSSSDVWSTTDGRNWVLETTGEFPVRGDHDSVVFQDRLWIVAGYPGSGTARYDDVWYFEGGSATPTPSPSPTAPPANCAPCLAQWITNPAGGPPSNGNGTEPVDAADVVFLQD